MKIKETSMKPAWSRKLAIAAAASLLGMSSLAFAQMSGTSQSNGAASANGASTTTTTTTTKTAPMQNGTSQSKMMAGDMKQAMDASNQQLMSMQSTGDTDRDFAAMMRAHHQGAIDMAQMEMANGKDPKMRAMARKIMNNNKKEMKQFDNWMSGKKTGAKKSGASKKGAMKNGSSNGSSMSNGSAGGSMMNGSSGSSSK